jgi:hypothetical protein
MHKALGLIPSTEKESSVLILSLFFFFTDKKSEALFYLCINSIKIHVHFLCVRHSASVGRQALFSRAGTVPVLGDRHCFAGLELTFSKGVG